jgi:hypothetical protein
MAVTYIFRYIPAVLISVENKLVKSVNSLLISKEMQGVPTLLKLEFSIPTCL